MKRKRSSEIHAMGNEPSRSARSTTNASTKSDDDNQSDDDSNCSEDSSVSEEYPSDGDDEEDELSDLPRRLYYFAVSKLDQDKFASINTALKAISTAKTTLFESNEELKKIYEKSKTKIFDERKVPPGSSLVQRSIDDDRYLMSLLCIQHGILLELTQAHTDTILRELQSALLWYPRSMTANYLYGNLLKKYSTTSESFNKTYTHYYKAVAIGKLLKKSINDGELKYDGLSEENRELIDQELQSFTKAQDAMILYLCQENKFNDALPYLRSSNYTWRLSRQVLHYPLSWDSTTNVMSVDLIRPIDHLIGIDNFLPQTMLDHLKYVFRMDSPFWFEHQYDFNENFSWGVGYFSYLFPIKHRRPVCSIEQIIDYTYRQLICFKPDLIECEYAEWWTHSRPHCSGHQLHFDSDETAIESGLKPNHPIATVLLFVDGNVGGPTLITNQILGGDLASNGWLCYPKPNRAVLFDSKYLHGVIPGRGQSPNINSKRQTFMIGFWKNIRAKYRGIDQPGPAQPFPGTTIHVNDGILCDIPKQDSHKTWHEEMKMISLDDCDDKKVFEIVEVCPISRVWEPVDHLDDQDIHNSLLISQPSYSSCFQGF